MYGLYFLWIYSFSRIHFIKTIPNLIQNGIDDFEISGN